MKASQIRKKAESNLKGIVIRTTRTPFTSIKNGMGVKLLEKDDKFMDFIESLSI